MGRSTRRNELSSSSSSENSPKYGAKRNLADADVATMACTADKQDDSLIKDIKDLKNNYNELQKSLEFSQVKIDELTKSNSDLQIK